MKMEKVGVVEDGLGGNGAIWRSRTLAAQNGSVAPPTTFQ